MKQSLVTTMYFGVFVLGILGVSAIMVPYPPNTKFSYKYITYDLIRNAECSICFGEECLMFEPAQCKYYMETEDVVGSQDDDTVGPLNTLLQNEVDSLFFDIVEKAQSYPDLECIPYISRYTDCTKENVCLGCQTCLCTEEGIWNCSTSYCRTNPDIDVDHRTLVKLVEILNENSDYYRKKREVTDTHIEFVNGNTMSLEELSEIIYGAPLRDQEQENRQSTLGQSNNDITVKQVNKKINEVTRKPDGMKSVGNNVTSPNTQNATKSQSEYNNTTSFNFQFFETTIPTNPDYIAFEEVLNDIAFDNKTRRKPPLEIVSSSPQIDNITDFDYMLIDDYKDNMAGMSFVGDVAQNEGTEPPQEEVTKIVIDLLESAKIDGVLNETDYIEVAANKENLVGLGFDSNNAIYDYDTLNLMKRDVSKVLESTNNTDLKIINVVEVENNTDKQDNKITLKQHILLPLIKFINSKRNELNDLRVIKDNLIKFMNNHNDSPIIEIIDYPNISDTNILRDLEMFPNLLNDFRRRHPAVLQKFLIKLKADVYEVIKDILGIQRFRQGKMSDDMNTLIYALKHYIGKGKEYKKQLKSKKKRMMMFRRRYDSDNSDFAKQTFKQCIIEIIQAIDTDMPSGNALAPLSGSARKILRHMIDTYYRDKITNVELRVHDPKYNMTNDLYTIGNNWNEMSSLVLDKSPIITHYKIKLLHIQMMKDIEKIKVALSLTNLAHNRRKMFYLKKVDNSLVDHIDNGLHSVQSNMQVIVEFYSKKTKRNQMKHKLQTSVRMLDNNDFSTLIKSTVTPNLKKHKKNSFFRHILNLLKSSKHEKLLDKQLPKSEIVKQLAKRKLDELTEKRFNEYEEAMKRWQKSLGVNTRLKRHTEDQLLGRIKNIIPKYLRHKVHPKLQDKKNLALKGMNKTGKKKKKNHGGHKRTKATLTTTTTPKPRTTSKNTRVYKASPTRVATSTKTTAKTTKLKTKVSTTASTARATTNSTH